MRYHDWSIWQAVFSLTARLLQKHGLIAKMSLEEKLETYLKEMYANDEKTTKNSEADIPDFRAGFLEILEEDRRRMEKDKLDEDNSSRELDDLIAADKSSNTVKNTKYKQVDGNFNGMNIPCALDELFGKFFKDVHEQNAVSANQTVFQVFPKKQTRVIFVLLVIHCFPFVLH